MSASTLYVNGKVTRIPSSNTSVDAAALNGGAGISSTGVLALVGTAKGGTPISAIDATKPVKEQLQVARTPAQVLGFFDGGDLKEVGRLAMAPSSDVNIPSGPAEEIFIKVNKSTKSALAVSNSDGATGTFKSKKYGYSQNSLSVQVGDDAGGGKVVTILEGAPTDPTNEEIFTAIGQDAFFNAQYSGAATSMTLEVDPAVGITANVSHAALGEDNQITAGTTGGVVTIDSTVNLPSDIGLVVTVYGEAPAPAPAGTFQTEKIVLNGTTAVAGVKTWLIGSISAMSLNVAAVGTVTLKEGAVTLAALAPAATEAGISQLGGLAIDNAQVTLATTTAGADVWVVGKSSLGVDIAEKVATSTGGVLTVGSWSQINYLIMGLAPVANTTTMTGVSVKASIASEGTLKKAADLFGSKNGWAFTTLVGNAKNVPLASIDKVASADITALKSFFAVNYDMATKITAGSGLVDYVAAAGATGGPDNTTGASSLVGAHEGSAVNPAVPTATNADWIEALLLLQKVDCNTVVPITADQAVHASVIAHVNYMGAQGKSERDAVLGVLDTSTGLVLADKADFKAQVRVGNNRNVGYVGQEFEQFNLDGERTTFPPQYLAAMIGAAQSGAPVGEPLTNKNINVLAIRSDSSWNGLDDAEEMIEGGALFLASNDVTGITLIRNVTSAVSSTNPVFTERSANHALNVATKSFRDSLNFAIGRPAFSGTLAAIKAEIFNIVPKLIDDGILTSWKPDGLRVELLGDTVTIDLSWAVIEPLNFVDSQIHLFRTQLAA